MECYFRERMAARNLLFNDQYAERVEQLKDKTFACQAPFWQLEATIYRLLTQTLFEENKKP